MKIRLIRKKLHYYVFRRKLDKILLPSNYKKGPQLKLVCFTILISVILHSSKVRSDIFPLPLKVNLNKDKVRLGELLFRDPGLSKSGTVSCLSCHDIDRAGHDGLQFSIGIEGRVGNINAPTVFNSRYNFRQFWDGRARNLEDQVDGPLLSPKEMGNTWANVIKYVKSEDKYRKLFKDAYDGKISSKTIKNAIAIFEKSLITPNSRFDQFLRGNKKALSDKEISGYSKFRKFGCISCHQGINIGGNMYQVFGAVEEYFKE